MSSEIRIDYEAVYSKTAELRQRIDAEIREMDVAYRHAQTSMRRMDGATNAAFMETMAINQEKAQVTVATLHELLAFIDASARQVERNEQLIARVLDSSGARVRRTGGRA